MSRLVQVAKLTGLDKRSRLCAGRDTHGRSILNGAFPINNGKSAGNSGFVVGEKCRNDPFPSCLDSSNCSISGISSYSSLLLEFTERIEDLHSGATEILFVASSNGEAIASRCGGDVAVFHRHSLTCLF